MFEEMKGARIHIFEETEVESTASPSFVELRNSISSRVDSRLAIHRAGDEIHFESSGRGK